MGEGTARPYLDRELMKRFPIASAASILLALPPSLLATSLMATNPYVARYSLDYQKNDPAPVAAAGVPCAEIPLLAAPSPNSAGALVESIQSGSLLRAPQPSDDVGTTDVPEPGTLGPLGRGLFGLGLSRWTIARITR